VTYIVNCAKLVRQVRIPMADSRENSRGRKETRCVNTRALGTMSDPLEIDL